MRTRSLFVTVLICTAAFAAAAPAPDADAWRRAEPGGRAWNFPADHHALPDYRHEWWYVTGHLASADDADPRWGYQLTFFRVGLRPGERDTTAAWSARDLVMAHAAVTDVATGGHVFSEILVRAVDPLGGFGAGDDSVLAWCAAPPGTPGRWSFRLDGDGFALTARDDRRGLDLDLRLAPERPPVFHGPGGWSPKSDDGSGASLYYSYTRLRTEGRVGGAEVAGRSWFDREVFTGSLTAEQSGWDWISLHLDDGRDLMVYRLRRPDGSVDFGRGSLVGADGSLRILHPEDWTWTAAGTWTSPASGATYPSSWRLEIPDAGVDLAITPEVADCENASPRSGMHYWEGPVRAAGSTGGRGYVELTGYGEGARPPI